jgi:GT2 family glycosyltransferase
MIEGILSSKTVLDQPGRLTDINSWHEHIPFAFWCIEALMPRVFVELGTHKGDSYCAFCQAVQRLSLSTTCYAVDTWMGDPHAGLYGEEVFESLRTYHDARYGSFSRLLRATFDEASRHFSDHSIDLLHIDGLHTYEAVRHDFKTWFPKMSEVGVVLVHDINVRERDFGVWRFWEEVSRDYPNYSFIHGHGLGVLAVGKTVPDSLKELFSNAPSVVDTARKWFAYLGRSVSNTYLTEELQRALNTVKTELQAREEVLQTEITELRHAAAKLREDLSHREQELSVSRSEAATARDAAAKLREDLSHRDQELQASQAELAKAKQLVLQKQETLSRITESLSWRMTDPVRRMSKSFPRVSRVMKGAAKLIYWTTTLQLRERLRHRRMLRLLIASGLFDAGFYLRQYPDVLEAGVDPLKHFCVHGMAEGRNPNPYFDTSFYLSRNPDVAAAGMNPLLHYLVYGFKEGRDPGPQFSGKLYYEMNPDVASLGVNPLSHFLEYGVSEGRSLPVSSASIRVPFACNDVSKQILQEQLRCELSTFLESDERLTFPKVVAPTISVLIVLYNQAHFTLRCLRALLDQKDANFEVVLVDNCSTDQTAELLARLDNVHVLINRENEGFLRGVNQAASVAHGRALLMLNNDAVVRPKALSRALGVLESDPAIGAVGGRIVRPSGRLQEAGCIIWADGSTVGYARELQAETGEAMFRRVVDYCSAAFLLTPKALFNQLGGFDVVYAPGYYEEADYCERLRQVGKRVVYEPSAVIEHYEFGSSSPSLATAQTLRNRKIFRTRHLGTLTGTHYPASEANVLFARDAIRGRKRLLMIEREVPLKALGSGFPRAQAMLNEAVAAGWFVTLYPLHVGNCDWETAYAELSSEIEICDQRCIEGLKDFLQHRKAYYDVILVSRPENMELFQEVVQDDHGILAGVRLIYDAEALWATRDVRRARLEGRVISQEEENALIASEIRLTNCVDAVVSVTPQEAAIFRSLQPAPVHVLSHLVRLVSASPSFEQRRGLLFVGRLLEKEAPNYDGLSWFIQSVWPSIRAALGDIDLVVVGALHPNPTELRAAGVQLMGPVNDLSSFYDQTRVFIAPVRYAAGLPIKVLEAAAAGVPVLATSLVDAQLGWALDGAIAASDDPAMLTEHAVTLYQSPEKWEMMRQAAQNHIVVEHGIENFRETLMRLLNGAAA